MNSIEIIEAIRAGRRTPSCAPEYDQELLNDIVAIPDTNARMNALGRAIDASEVVDGWPSDILVGAKAYILHGLLPPMDE